MMMKVHGKLIKAFGVLLIAVLLIAALPASEAMAQTYDVNPGDSIQAAILAATAGDTITIAPGTYAEKDILIDRSLIIIGDPGDTGPGPGVNAPVLDGSSFTYGDAFKIADGVSDVVIEGFVIQNYARNPGSNGIGNGISAWQQSTSNITIQDNYFTNLGWNGVLVGNDGAIGDHDNWLIKNNILDTWSFYGFELTNTSNSSIEDNIITADLVSDPETAIAIIARRDEANITIQRNIINGEMNYSLNPILIFAWDADGYGNPTLDNVVIRNNELNIVNSGGEQIRVWEISGTITDADIINNHLRSVNNATSNVLVVSPNWWGASSGPVSGDIVGDVKTNPWCYTEDCTELYVAEGGSIQDAINAASDGDTIHVAPGTYAEQLVVDKALTLLGPNTGVPGTGTRVAEAEINFPSGLTGYQPLVEVTADNVSIEGLLIDGQDFPMATAWSDANITDGILADASNFTAKNNIVKNFSRVGVIIASDHSTGLEHAGILVEDNLVTSDAVGYFSYYGGIYLQKSYGVVRGNTVNMTYRGIQIQPYNHANAANMQGMVENNNITAYRNPLYFNYSENANGDWSFENNTVSGNTVSGDSTSRWDGLLVQSFTGGNVAFTGNTVNFGTTDATEVYPFGVISWGSPGGTVDLDATFANNTFERAVVITDGTNIIKTQPDMAFYSMIQDAIDDASDGDTIEVGPGTYNEAISVGKALNVIGSGDDITVIDGTGLTDTTLFASSGLTNGTLEVSGFTFKDDPTPAANMTYLVSFHGCQDPAKINFHNNTLIGSGDYEYDWGLLAGYNGSCETVINHNTFDNIGGNNILIERATGPVEIGFNDFSMPPYTTSGVPAIWSMSYGDAANPNTVTGTHWYHNNTIHGQTEGQIIWSGIGIAPAWGTGWDVRQYGTYEDVLIEDNTVEDFYNVGIQVEVDGSESTFNGVIQNNVLTAYPSQPYSKGIRLLGPVTDTQLLGNDIKEGYRGIYLSGTWGQPIYPTGITVENNNLAGNEIGYEEQDTSADQDISPNWWGSACGPAEGYVVGNIDYTPWCCDQTCSSYCVPETTMDSVDDAYNTVVDGVLTVDIPGVLENDIGGAPALTAQLVTDVVVGEGTLDWSAAQDGSFTYTPPPGWVGTTTFTYRSCGADDICACEPATVTITVLEPLYFFPIFSNSGD